MAKKPCLGRQKIKMARIEKASHRQVTFSKRRSGLFKKACELCTLCGVEILIVVFSPANKVFSFGHPNVESLVGGKASAPPARVNTSVQELNGQLTRVNGLINGEKDRKESLERGKEWWWETPVEKLGRSQLEELASSLEELKKTVAMQAKLVSETASLKANSPAADEFTGFGGTNGFGNLVEN